LQLKSESSCLDCQEGCGQHQEAIKLPKAIHKAIATARKRLSVVILHDCRENFSAFVQPQGPLCRNDHHSAQSAAGEITHSALSMSF
jgi:ribosomal protein S5